MQHEIRKYLWDLEESINDILVFAKGKNFSEYADDNMLRAAIERKFEIIGEVVVRIARHFPEYVDQLEGCRRFIGFRNVLAHRYDENDDASVWRGIEASLPQFQKQVIALREELDLADPLDPDELEEMRALVEEGLASGICDEEPEEVLRRVIAGMPRPHG